MLGRYVGKAVSRGDMGILLGIQFIIIIAGINNVTIRPVLVPVSNN